MPTKGIAAAEEDVLEGKVETLVVDAEDTSGNKIMNEVLCNGRRCVSEPEWTRVRPRSQSLPRYC